MMEWTDRHCRSFHRTLTKEAVLYTEMVTTGAIIHGGSQRFLHYSPIENPVAFQLGGSSPKDLALCAKMDKLVTNTIYYVCLLLLSSFRLESLIIYIHSIVSVYNFYPLV
jgi:hypothetical protein